MRTSPPLISKTVLLLSFISLFTDIASEMLYPVLPMYLQSVGFSMLFIGVLEGMAEATAGLSKGYFGHWSDRAGRRKPFIQLGYGMSAVAKPAMILFSHVAWVFAMRTLDRLGKGIRTGARDALLSTETTAANKASVFGFHRGMDTLGAAIGPFIALVFLSFYPSQYQTLFVFALVPGVIAIAISSLIKETRSLPQENIQRPGFLDFLGYWKSSPSSYKKLVAALIFFSLTNSSDVFLLLMLKKHGLNDSAVIGVYVFYNLVYAASSYPIGRLTDKIGFKWSLLVGLALFAFTYLGMSEINRPSFYWFLFFSYGLYAACTEGMSKAWITNLVPAHYTATAIGFYTSFSSIALMFASILAGYLWSAVSPAAPFWLGGIGALITLLFLAITPISNQLKP
ncbi:MAG TPA: MFS transporter [Pseudomonadales bacterium]|nr:MFS transporter [Pseudomonadales bacterium]